MKISSIVGHSLIQYNTMQSIVPSFSNLTTINVVGLSISCTNEANISYIKRYLNFLSTDIADFLLKNSQFSDFLKDSIAEIANNHVYWNGELKFLTEEYGDKKKLLFIYRPIDTCNSSFISAEMSQKKVSNKRTYKKLITNLFYQPKVVKASILIDEQPI